MSRVTASAKRAIETLLTAARLLSKIAVERLKLEVARLRRERFWASSERSARIGQLELTLENLEETLAETEAQRQPSLRAGPKRI